MKSYFYKNYASLQHLSWKCVPGQRSYSRDRARTTGAMQSELLHIIRDPQAGMDSERCQDFEAAREGLNTIRCMEGMKAGEWVCGVGSGLSKIALTFHLPGHKLEERAWMYFRL